MIRIIAILAILISGNLSAQDLTGLSEQYSDIYCENSDFLSCANVQERECFSAMTFSVENCQSLVRLLYREIEKN